MSSYGRSSARMSMLVIAGTLLIFPAHTNAQSQAASLYMLPASGTYVVGSTFTVSIFINTNGQNINAVEANLRFPPDKLQVVSPSAGKSIIGIWIAQPSSDNLNGRLSFQGAIPSPGIITNQGLISQITFRVIGVGTAALRFGDNSKILLNDGKGTDILGETSGGIYNLILPPPAGPLVTSPTHPDQESWYSNPTADFEWISSEKVQAFSYVLSDVPVDTPDNTSEGTKNSTIYKNIQDGIHYFHLKALRDGTWGGVTHYAVRIDTSPPAAFPINILPRAKTTARRISVDFKTTDALSGVDHYEIKIIRLSPSNQGGSEQALFIETQTPYVAELPVGSYNVLVRAYDKAGNYVQEEERLKIVDKVFEFIDGEGLRLGANFIIPWGWAWGIAGFLMLLFAYIAHIFWERHTHAHQKLSVRELPEEVKKQLEELRELKNKYSKFLLILMAVLIYRASFGMPSPTAAQSETSPPIITLVSQNISNEEIFYIGGKTDFSQATIIIYLQSLENGQTTSFTVVSDKNGDWFYSHSKFLPSGEYLLWTQLKAGPETSPPSPQVRMTVSPTAIQFGASRLSYETIYLFISFLLLGIIILFILIALYHSYHHREKNRRLIEEIRRTEEALQRGFAVLKRDIEAELAFMHKTKTTRELSLEEKQKEEMILSDLERIKDYIGKEIWELEQELK